MTFITGMLIGEQNANRELDRQQSEIESLEEKNRRLERDILRAKAAIRAQVAVRNAVADALREIAPNSPVFTSNYCHDVGTKAFDVAIRDPNLRNDPL